MNLTREMIVALTYMPSAPAEIRQAANWLLSPTPATPAFQALRQEKRAAVAAYAIQVWP